METSLSGKQQFPNIWSSGHTSKYCTIISGGTLKGIKLPEQLLYCFLGIHHPLGVTVGLELFITRVAR